MLASSHATTMKGKSLAVRFDGSKNSSIGYSEKILYFHIYPITPTEIISFIKKIEKDKERACHQFYIMKKEGNDKDGYKMIEKNGAIDGSSSNEPIDHCLYYDWNGEEDLTKASKR